MSHEFDEDGSCVHCGFDGAEWHWWKTSTYEGRSLAGAECEPEDRLQMPECKSTKQKPHGAQTPAAFSSPTKWNLAND